MNAPLSVPHAARIHWPISDARPKCLASQGQQLWMGVSSRALHSESLDMNGHMGTSAQVIRLDTIFCASVSHSTTVLH